MSGRGGVPGSMSVEPPSCSRPPPASASRARSGREFSAFWRHRRRRSGPGEVRSGQVWSGRVWSTQGRRRGVGGAGASRFVCGALTWGEGPHFCPCRAERSGVWLMEDASPRSELGEILTSEMGDILDIVSHNHIPTMILRVPTLVIVAASPGAHELLDPLAQPLIGHSLRDFMKSHPSGAMPLLESGRISGYDTLQVIKATGQRRRLWISALPDTESTGLVIALLLKAEGALANPRSLEGPSLVLAGDRLWDGHVRGAGAESLTRRSGSVWVCMARGGPGVGWR